MLISDSRTSGEGRVWPAQAGRYGWSRACATLQAVGVDRHDYRPRRDDDGGGNHRKKRYRSRSC
jgi:hypothetical protein